MNRRNLLLLVVVILLAKEGSAQEPTIPLPDRFGLTLQQKDGTRVIVLDVAPESPAEAAEILPGDEIITVNDDPVGDVRVVTRAFAGLEEGDKVTLELRRNDRTIVTVVKAIFEPAPAKPATAAEPAAADVGFMGMLLREVAPGRVLVTRVSPHTAAEAAGIRPGDWLVSIDRHSASPLTELIEFSVKLVDGMAPGDLVRAKIARKDETKAVDLVVQEPPPPERPAPDPVMPGDVLTAVGIALLERPSGTVRITSVVDHSPAAIAGLRRGDVLIAVDGMEIHSAADAVTAFTPHRPNETLPVEIVRDEQAVASALTLRAEPAELADYVKALQAENESLARTIEMLSKELESLRKSPETVRKPAKR